ncbi:MAG: hypothetical protein GF331_17450 [Chitinivibrionales bacterium]|nr:hypothetical protein [Chitinivibrionales bacterium]
MRIAYGTASRAAALVAGVLWTQAAAIDVTVDQNVTYQTIEAIGLAQNPATYTSVWKYKSGPFFIPVDYDAIHYYDTVIADLGITGMRDDPITGVQATPGDFTLPSTVRWELQTQARLKEAAEQAGEPFWVLWNCFSPPAWMKANNSEVALPGDWGDLYQDPNNYLLPEHYEDYADHWIRIMEIARDTFGLTVDFVSLQNEPLFNEPYVSCNYAKGPGCGWNGVCYNNMFKVVAPRIKAAFPDVRFIASEDAGNRTVVESALRADPISNPLVYAWASHNDFASSFAYWDDRPIWNTEPHGEGFLNDAEMCMSNLAAGASVWLDGANGGRFNGSCDTSGTPDTECMKSGVYSALKMFSRYVRPGAVRIQSTGTVGGSYGVIAFYHPDDVCLSIVLINSTGSTEAANLSISGAYQPAQLEAYYSTATEDEVPAGSVALDGTYLMPPYSVSTLVAGTYRGTPTVNSARSTRPARTRVSAVKQTAPARLYTIDGRLATPEKPRDITAARSRLAPGLYCAPRAFRGAGKRAMMVVGD